MSTTSSVLTILLTIFFAASCKSVIERQDVRPKVLRDVPARNLAYRLAPDVTPPSSSDDSADKHGAVANDFSTKRKDEALVRPRAGRTKSARSRWHRRRTRLDISHRSLQLGRSVSTQPDPAGSLVRVSGN